MPTSKDLVRIPLDLTDIPSHKVFSRPPPKILFHYTSLDGARGIIESRSLRLTKVAYLNDRSELAFAIRLFRGAADRLSPSVEGEDRKSLLAETARQLGSFEQTNICVASFCEDRDLLSQWRSYGSAGRGVALGFSGPVLSRINNSGWAHLVRCVYDATQQQQVTEDLVGILLNSYDIAICSCPPEGREKLRSDIIGYFNTTFLRVAPVLKDRHFAEEKEWRIVTVPRKTTDPKFQALVSNTRVSQHYVHDFAPDTNGAYDFLESVEVGPTTEPQLIGGAIGTLCRRQSIQLSSIGYSQIPFRG